MKKYQIIYADPPWQYAYTASNSRRIENKYPTMDLEDIKNLVIPAEDNSVCYMWTTAPKLAEGIDTLRAWGFDYRSCLIWDKENLGMGYWFRGQHEILLVGVKGGFSPPPQSMRISSVLRQKRSEHSAKPPIIRDLINKWYPDKTKIELFARKKDTLFELDDWKGWDVWGNEVESDIDLEGLTKQRDDEYR